VKRLNKAALQNLLHLYDGAILELERLGDPGVAGLVWRLRAHRTEVVSALAALAALAT
jgi:hypothetical protein